MGSTALSVTPVIMALVQEGLPENRALANGVYVSFGFLLNSAVVVVLGAMGGLFGLAPGVHRQRGHHPAGSTTHPAVAGMASQ